MSDELERLQADADACLRFLGDQWAEWDRYLPAAVYQRLTHDIDKLAGNRAAARLKYQAELAMRETGTA